MSLGAQPSRFRERKRAKDQAAGTSEAALDPVEADALGDPAIPEPWRALLEGLAEIMADDILTNLDSVGRGAEGPLPVGVPGP